MCIRDRIKSEITIEEILPACAQGAIGVECLSDDPITNESLKSLHDTDTASRVYCERSLNARLGGSCQTPIAAYAVLKQDQLLLKAMIAMPDGSTVLRAEGEDHRDNGVELGNRVAEMLIADGADKIISHLADLRHDAET